MPPYRSSKRAILASGTGPSETSKYFTTHCHSSRRIDSDGSRITAETDVGAQYTPDKIFPSGYRERELYRTPAGKKLTSHQWDVYDFALKIPTGKVTTYKDVANSVGGSPRSVGNALRCNPFAPYVPCHRVIASNYFVGGFFGEWGNEHKSGTRYNQKLDLLSTEGVKFDARGYLLAKDRLMRSLKRG